MGLQRQIDRQRRVRHGDEHPKVLDAQNEQLSRRGFTLHPTKGFRPISERRSRVQMFMADQKAGKIPPFHFNYSEVIVLAKRFIKTGLWA